jgi:subtilisin family serine protease
VPFYNTYIDESGDEGFTTVATAAQGSSEWLILTGVLVPEEDDLALSHAVDDLRTLLNKQPHRPLHFRELKHGGRRAAMTRLATYSLVFCTVALWKPGITSAYLQQPPHLYNYACRYLIERLTWYADNKDAACFEKDGNGFGWLQGTSVAAPNLTGVAALVLSAHPDLRGHADGLLARLQSTARQGLANATGSNDPGNTAAGASGTACPSGYCHLDYAHPIPFAQAYGAGLVDAAAAVG